MLVADVFDATLIDNSTGAVFGSASLTAADIQVAVTANEVRAGKGNQLISTLHSGRNITLTLTDAKVRNDWIAAEMGQEVVTGAGVAYASPKNYTVVDGGTSKPTITLGQTPITDTIKVYKEDGTAVTGFTVTAKDIDFTSATPTVAIGDLVEVRTYQYATDAQTQTINIDNTVFPKDVTAILSTWEIDEDTEAPVFTEQYQFPVCKPDGNFQLQTATAKNAVTQQMVLTIMKPKDSDVVGKKIVFPFVAE